MTDAIFEEKVADAEIVIGQINLPKARLDQAQNLRTIINVERDYLHNIDYAHVFHRGICALNVSAVFAEPAAEEALGMALDRARGISEFASKPVDTRIVLVSRTGVVDFHAMLDAIESGLN